ncbi:hypothetical protein BB560_001937 [Smittium megazygosporum]|uniref:Globin-sensor domain-containing protein n=1 Tax=Smittium megazygosporum TaxID=133381 RepID=A0A2T9ZG90_9FUNG|nr:hypothetical protein BB560_001937 [Smittium megazygosporum]
MTNPKKINRVDVQRHTLFYSSFTLNTLEEKKYRTEFVVDFLEFTPEDHKLILELAPTLGPLVGPITDAVYEKLFSFDITKASFTEKQIGFSGDLNELEKLTLNDPVIKFRKSMLSKYLVKLVSDPFDDAWIKYFDWVGEIHSYSEKKKYKSSVDFIHLNGLLGFVSSAVSSIVVSADNGWDMQKKLAAVQAFKKFCWLQNDYLAKYHLPKPGSKVVPVIRARTNAANKKTDTLGVSQLLGIGTSFTVGALAATYFFSVN